MLLKVVGARHMDRKAYHPSQPIQANGVPCYGQSVANCELGRSSTQLNRQFLSNPAYKRRRFALSP